MRCMTLVASSGYYRHWIAHTTSFVSLQHGWATEKAVAGSSCAQRTHGGRRKRIGVIPTL